MNTFIARNAARNVRTAARPRTTAVTARRYASDPVKNPAPPPQGPPPLAEAEGKGAGMPFIIGALVATIGVGGYFYVRRDAGQKAEESKDVKLKARELDHAAHVQAQQKIDDGRQKFDQAKGEGRAKVDSAQSGIQSTYNDTTNKANNMAADAQARVASYRDSAAASLQSTKEATEKAAHDAKHYTEDKAQQVQNSWWNWFGWGKSKGEDVKETAAAEAAKAAREVKNKAAEAEKGAQKRT